MRIIMHGHHAGTLFSVLPSLEARVAEIKRYKPEAEWALRLALMQDVTDLLPDTPRKGAFMQAREAFDKAGADYHKVRKACDKAAGALDALWNDYHNAQEALDKAAGALDALWNDYHNAQEALDKVGAAYLKAWEAYLKAWEAYGKAAEAYGKAAEALDKAKDVYLKAWVDYSASFDVEAFHREHCHPRCPWDGKTIFAKGTGIEVLS